MIYVVGIKDIVKKVGVFILIVFYVFNGSLKVIEKMWKWIMIIVNELNYIFNMVVWMLKIREIKIIGVYLMNYGGIFYGILLEGLM